MRPVSVLRDGHTCCCGSQLLLRCMPTRCFRERRYSDDRLYFSSDSTSGCASRARCSATRRNQGCGTSSRGASGCGPGHATDTRWARWRSNSFAIESGGTAGCRKPGCGTKCAELSTQRHGGCSGNVRAIQFSPAEREIVERCCTLCPASSTDRNAVSRDPCQHTARRRYGACEHVRAAGPNLSRRLLYRYL